MSSICCCFYVPSVHDDDDDDDGDAAKCCQYQKGGELVSWCRAKVVVTVVGVGMAAALIEGFLSLAWDCGNCNIF